MTGDAQSLPRRDRSFWRWFLIIAFAVGVGGILAAVNIEKLHRGVHARISCMNNLAQLGGAFLMRRSAPAGGTSLWLAYRKDHSGVKRGAERTLVCPMDDEARPPSTEDEERAWDDVDLAHPPRELCSYAGRDVERCPLDPSATDKEPLGACLHHEGVAIVAFSDGSVRTLTLAELGLASDAEKIVGPESTSPLLRVLRY